MCDHIIHIHTNISVANHSLDKGTVGYLDVLVPVCVYLHITGLKDSSAVDRVEPFPEELML